MSIYKYFILLFQTVLVLKEALSENYKTTRQLFPQETATVSQTNWHNKIEQSFLVKTKMKLCNTFHEAHVYDVL